jgi:Protein of unknown function DUF262
LEYRHLKTTNFCELFSDSTTELLTITCLADWRQAKEGSRLFLPPIQRSVVWSNEQIINYWDSLLRGYSAGMMLVHRVKNGENAASRKGRDADGATLEANEEDFQLFDGQQRITAILLGIGRGQLKDSRKLWIDLGAEATKSSGLMFQLRITSTGQPFGYKPDAPNQKLELNKRWKKWEEWRNDHNGQATLGPEQAFASANGSDLIDATCAIPFTEVCDCLSKGVDREEIIKELLGREGASEKCVREFIGALERALNTRVVLQQVDPKIVADQEDYIRFFTRLGQGGTRLSDDELTYSIIKHNYPEIHDRMKDIMSQAGRLAGEVDLVLATLRVAKTIAPWDKAHEWEVISRPSPTFVSKLKERRQVESAFLAMIIPNGQTAILETALKEVRKGLSYNKKTHPKGLPTMLLARLPRELVDVLILFSVKRGFDKPWQEDINEILCAFVLYWLLFIHDDGKAAWRTFQHAKEQDWVLTREAIRELIGEYEKEGEAYFAPRQDTLPCLREEVKNGNHILRSWADRFKAADHIDERKPGEALRILSSKLELCKRALMWLQRDYIASKWENYDPTSDRDEDLPIDLDHIVPNGIFNFRWNPSRLKEDVIFDNPNNFRWERDRIGNSIGNFRWLDVSKNRGRGKKEYEPLPNNGDLVSNPTEWEALTSNDTKDYPWSKDNIATFQRLIDLRTLELYESLLTGSGIDDILPANVGTV